jgi:hypothetical protein
VTGSGRSAPNASDPVAGALFSLVPNLLTRKRMKQPGSAVTDGKLLSRTQWAELHVESVVAPAFIAEFVFRSPQIIDRGCAHEVADLLITRADQALLVSQKCQEDPGARDADKTRAWARKQAVKAAAQLKGALRRVGIADEIWCQHPRRGRVAFPEGLPPITHALAIVEVFERSELGDDVPVESQETPISYLSVSDFLNLSQQLRTVPEIIRYLDARRGLPAAEQRMIGCEHVFFSYYLLCDGSFDGFTDYDAAVRVLRLRDAELRAGITAKAERDRYSFLIEHVADQLAGRHALFAEGLSAEVLAKYEPTGDRRGYLQMQEILAGMQLAERASLGLAFQGASDERHARGGRGFTFRAAQVPSLPDVVFVLGSFGESPTFTRDRLLASFHALVDEAMMHYDCTRCLIIVDRDGKSYDVALGVMTVPFSLERKAIPSKDLCAVKDGSARGAFSPDDIAVGAQRCHPIRNTTNCTTTTISSLR